MPPSKYEANPTLCLRVNAFLYLFPLASLCSNDYFRAYVIIDFLANWLVFLNMVTFGQFCYHGNQLRRYTIWLIIFDLEIACIHVLVIALGKF